MTKFFYILGVVFPLPLVAAATPGVTPATPVTPQQPQQPLPSSSTEQHLLSSNTKKLSQSLDHLNSSSSQVAMWKSDIEVCNRGIQIQSQVSSQQPHLI